MNKHTTAARWSITHRWFPNHAIRTISSTTAMHNHINKNKHNWNNKPCKAGYYFWISNLRYLDENRIIIKADVERIACGWVLTGFNWHRIGTSGLLRTWKLTFGFHKRQGKKIYYRLQKRSSQLWGPPSSLIQWVPWALSRRLNRPRYAT